LSSKAARIGPAFCCVPSQSQVSVNFPVEVGANVVRAADGERGILGRVRRFDLDGRGPRAVFPFLSGKEPSDIELVFEKRVNSVEHADGSLRCNEQSLPIGPDQESFAGEPLDPRHQSRGREGGIALRRSEDDREAFHALADGPD